MAAAFWLEREGYSLIAPQDTLVETVLAIIEHRLPLDDLASWLERHVVQL